MNIWSQADTCSFGHAESVSRADVKFETYIHRDSRIYQKPAIRRVRNVTAQERA